MSVQVTMDFDPEEFNGHTTCRVYCSDSECGFDETVVDHVGPIVAGVHLREVHGDDGEVIKASTQPI